MGNVTSCSLQSGDESARLRQIPKIERTYGWTRVYYLKKLFVAVSGTNRQMNRGWNCIASKRLRLDSVEIILKDCKEVL